MPVLRLSVPNADFSAVGLGKLINLPDIRTSLYAAYLFGTAYGPTPGKDITGNGRDATFVGGSPSTVSFVSVAGSYAQLPFSVANVAAANSEITVVCINKGIQTRADLLVGDYVQTIDTSGANLFQLAETGANYERLYSGTATQYTPVGTTNSYRGTGYEFMAGSSSLTAATVFSKHGTATALTSTITRTATGLGSANNLRAGGLGSIFTASAPEIVGVLVYNRALTNTELESVKASMTTILAGYGVTV